MTIHYITEALAFTSIVILIITIKRQNKAYDAINAKHKELFDRIHDMYNECWQSHPSNKGIPPLNITKEQAYLALTNKFSEYKKENNKE